MLTTIAFLAAVLSASFAQNFIYDHGFSLGSSPFTSLFGDEKQDEALPPPVVPHFKPSDDHIIPVVEDTSDLPPPVVKPVIPVTTFFIPAPQLVVPTNKHVAPSVQYVPPVVQHIAPAPVVHKVSHVVHNVAPVIHKVAPIVYEVAPIEHKLAPIEHKAVPVEHKATPSEHKEAHHEEHFGYPKYEFSYHVEDKHTGDIKSQHESRDGHVVKGEYSLHQPDGSVRIVKYSADKNVGFNADVHYDGHSEHIEPKHH